jgi:hypothetical protein
LASVLTSLFLLHVRSGCSFFPGFLMSSIVNSFIITFTVCFWNDFILAELMEKFFSLCHCQILIQSHYKQFL